MARCERPFPMGQSGWCFATFAYKKGTPAQIALCRGALLICQSALSLTHCQKLCGLRAVGRDQIDAAIVGLVCAA